MDTPDITPMVHRIADDMGIEVDNVLILEDAATMRTTVKVVKSIRGEQYTSQVRIDDQMLASKAKMKVLTHQLETMVRNLQDEAHEVYRPNDHYLVFETVDEDFHVEDHATGMEWDVEACFHSKFEESFDVPSDIPMDPAPDLSDELVQQMKMYLIGWALETDVDEARNKLYEQGYRHGNRSPGTERFKYHPH